MSIYYLTEGVHFVGWLAIYKYYNMDQVVAQALMVSAKLLTRGNSNPQENRYVTVTTS